MDLPDGADCPDDRFCSSRACRDDICVPLDQELGSNCSVYDEMCLSNACVEGKCADEKKADSTPCTADNDCVSSACGYNSYNASLASQVCCSSGENVRRFTSTSQGWPTSESRYFCTRSVDAGGICFADSICKSNECRDGRCWGLDLPDGAECFDDKICSSRACRDGVCVALDQPLGSSCNVYYVEMCESNACVDGLCVGQEDKCDAILAPRPPPTVSD